MSGEQVMLFSRGGGMLKLDYNIEVTTEQYEQIKTYIASLAGCDYL